MRADYIITHTNREVWLPGTDSYSIDVEDIAHALSMAPRFAGHMNFFYSVAQHCLNVARILPPNKKLQGLMHDGMEAYLCDIPTPFKAMLGNYEQLENDLWLAIAARYDLPVYLDPEVKEADKIMLMTERDILKPNSPKWSPKYEAVPRSDHPGLDITERPWREVKDEFIETFHELTGLKYF